VLSFLDQVFVAENIRSISAAELANRLDDELYALNERLAERLSELRRRRQELDDEATEPDLPVAVTQLMKGVVYRDDHDKAWRNLLADSRCRLPVRPAGRRRRISGNGDPW
jgi:hypothetical protein